MIFADRSEAGRRLAARLQDYAGRPDVLVLGIPRGGAIVAAVVAEALQVPWDVFTVRKIGVPGHEELAMGAVATGGTVVRNESVIESLGISDEVFDAALARQREELARREAAYRDARPPPRIRGQCMILIDDGFATGASMQAAIEGLRMLAPKQIVVAAPVAAQATCEKLGPLVDDLVCLEMPEPFFGVGQWYENFSQVTDEEVRGLLEKSRGPRLAGT